MPKKMLVLLVFLVIAGVLDVVMSVLTDSIDTGFVVGLAIRGAVIAGLLMGSEGVRVLLIVLAVIGLFMGVMALVAFTAATGIRGGLAPLAWGSVAFGIIANGFVLFVLRDTEVQKWMLRRSLGSDLVD